MKPTKPTLQARIYLAASLRRAIADGNFLAGLPATIAIAWLAITPAFASSPLNADAQVGGGGESFADAFFGEFRQSIPIAIPAFHGMEPKLSLNYDSGAGNGFLGVGWSLSGFSTIERVGPDKSSPQYDSTDTFLLDGNELIPCPSTGGLSPSCATTNQTGTLTAYSTKVESYQRIQLDTSVNPPQWYSWAKDGTKSTYTAVHWVTGVWKWGLTSVTDTHGNTVNYNWAINQFGCCWSFPDSVSYNRTIVKLFWEPRGDVETRANGTDVQTIWGRIKTIDISIDGSRVRAYKLIYAGSSTTSRSILASVQQFGKDAVLSGDGTVVGGAFLPASTFNYQTDGSAAMFRSTGGSANGSWMDTWCGPGAQFGTGDFNGDGKTDLWCHSNLGELWVALSNGTDSFTDRRMWKSNWCSNANQPNGWQIGTGDFNGDGKTDFYCHNWGSQWYETWVILSNGVDGFIDTGSRWIDGWCWAGAQLGTGDLNGDGKTDIWCHDNGGIWVALSNGVNAFTDGRLWKSNWCNNANQPNGWQFGTGDFNGDGKTDFYCHNWGSQWYETWVILSNGAGGFIESGRWMDGWCPAGSRLSTGDFNGDGRTDIWCHTSDGGNWIGISNGRNAFVDGSNWKPTWCAAGSYQMEADDFNGDGKTDILCHDSYGTTWIALSNGRTFVDGSTWKTSWCSDANQPNGWQFGTGDFNGDGKTDIYCHNWGMQWIETWVALSGSVTGTTDLLTSAVSPLGGTTTATYTPSSSWRNANAPPIVPTVVGVNRSDGRGWSATTSYFYDGGLYDRIDKRFLGFRYVKETQPCLPAEGSNCPYQETWFRQAYGAISKPELSKSWGWNPNLQLMAVWSQKVYEYLENGPAIPSQSLIYNEWSYEYDGSSANPCSSGWPCDHGRRTVVQHLYDVCATGNIYSGADSYRCSSWQTGFANPTRDNFYGDYDFVGDEKNITYTHRPNTSSYIVSAPAAVQTYDGLDSTTLLNATLNYYDGADTWDRAPSVGDLTKRLDWLDSPASYLSSRSEYDGYGNVTASYDGLENRTGYEYDPTYHVFLTTTTNALLQTTSTAWDTLCGLPRRITDLNNQVTDLNYDQLCRLSRKNAPLGAFEQPWYNNIGLPSSQNTGVYCPEPAGSSYSLWEQRNLDGLGRAYRVLKTGLPPDNYISVDSNFDARGNLLSTTLPYYVNDGELIRQRTTYSYDALNRVTRVTHPDASFVSTSYGYVQRPGAGTMSYVNTVDEMGHETQDEFDAWGRKRFRWEKRAGVWNSVRNNYDGHGYLIETIDPAGNRATFHSDSLGRKLTMTDPDQGTWSYRYDALGRLISQTDALLQETVIEYDALGRTTSKTTHGPEGPVMVAWTYDEPRDGYFNIGHLTTATDASGDTWVGNYDALGRKVQWTRTIAGTAYPFQIGYDEGSRVLWASYPDGDQVGTPAQPWRYDTAGRLYSIPGIVNSCLYHPAGRLTVQANANGTTTTYSYSPTREWLTDISTTRPGALIAQALNYTRDFEGKITRLISAYANEGWTYDYDEQHQLTSAVSASDPSYSHWFDYDATGNMISNSILGTYRYPPPQSTRPHAVIGAGVNTYNYDDNGNLIEGRGRILTYNGDNRPVSINGWTITYDANGSRVSKSSPSGEATLYVADDDYEIAPDGTVTKYIAGIAKRINQSTYWLHRDHLGSIQVITDAAGQEVQRQVYKPYGDRLATLTGEHTPPGFSESKGFTDERQDETGLFYLHARYYDPVLDRFISPDPTVPSERILGLNRYVYAGNNPANFSDKTGLYQDEGDGVGRYYPSQDIYYTQEAGEGVSIWMNSSGVNPDRYSEALAFQRRANFYLRRYTIDLGRQNPRIGFRDVRNLTMSPDVNISGIANYKFAYAGEDDPNILNLNWDEAAVMEENLVFEKHASLFAGGHIVAHSAGTWAARRMAEHLGLRADLYGSPESPGEGNVVYLGHIYYHSNKGDPITEIGRHDWRHFFPEEKDALTSADHNPAGPRHQYRPQEGWPNPRTVDETYYHARPGRPSDVALSTIPWPPIGRPDPDLYDFASSVSVPPPSVRGADVP